MRTVAGGWRLGGSASCAGAEGRPGRARARPAAAAVTRIPVSRPARIVHGFVGSNRSDPAGEPAGTGTPAADGPLQLGPGPEHVGPKLGLASPGSRSCCRDVSSTKTATPPLPCMCFRPADRLVHGRADVCPSTAGSRPPPGRAGRAPVAPPGSPARGRSGAAGRPVRARRSARAMAPWFQLKIGIVTRKPGLSSCPCPPAVASSIRAAGASRAGPGAGVRRPPRSPLGGQHVRPGGDRRRPQARRRRPGLGRRVRALSGRSSGRRPRGRSGFAAAPRRWAGRWPPASPPAWPAGCRSRARRDFERGGVAGLQPVLGQGRRSGRAAAGSPRRCARARGPAPVGVGQRGCRGPGRGRPGSAVRGPGPIRPRRAAVAGRPQHKRLDRQIDQVAERLRRSAGKTYRNSGFGSSPA